MPCNFIDLGNGVSIVACSRGSKRCRCGRPRSKLCDFPLKGSKLGQTCDEPLCDRCAKRVGQNRDYCPAHARVDKGGQ